VGNEVDDPMEKGRIRLLSDALVDQIAAGEVVERPASVVKELVENSIDAGAGRIRIEVRDGGAALIAVTDDGSGMSPAELPMALQRHATSKLSSAADLMRIASFGFRGEALPAIASVSRFRILSRTRGSDHGYEIQCDAGRIIHERAAGCPEGTRIEVADLFASVPARRKFLKRPGTEWGHIADWLARLAMVRPDVHIETQRDGRAATIWPACREPRERIAMILPEADAAALVEIDHRTPDCRIHAFVSTPEHSRPNGQGLYLYVNGRPVRDRLLRHALIESYRDLLPRGRFPIGVMFLEIAMDAVDVNVHPAKWEVRFSDPQAIHRAVRRAVREAMASRNWLGSVQAPRTDVGAPRETGSFFSADRGSSAAADPTTSDWIFAGRNAAVREGVEGPDRFGSTLREESLEVGTEADLHAVAGSPSGDRPVPSFAALPILGQLRASYVLAETGDGLIVVDQHAAHERILYEGLRKSWLDSGVARQGLLTPTPVTLSPNGLAALEAAQAVALRLGFEIEAFGEDAVLVRSVPAEVAGQDVSRLVTELASVLEEADSEAISDASAIRWLPSLDRLFATLACHSARRFGDRLPIEEQQSILAGLDAIPWAPTCPHGRPVAILIRHEDLEQRFRRR
jgi:DNA mismatch repair protein MutL